MSNTATITIKRDSGYADRLRNYQVVLDGTAIGTIGNGEECSFEIPMGKHRLHMKIDWGRSNVIDFETRAEPVRFECRSNLRGWRLLLAGLYATVFCGQYIQLEQQPDPTPYAPE